MRPTHRHANERLIDRILNGDSQLVPDDDERDYEPDYLTDSDADREYAVDADYAAAKEMG